MNQRENYEEEEGSDRLNMTGDEPQGKGRGTYTRRRFVTKVGNTHIKLGKNLKKEEVEDALNEDATTVEVMRREVLDSQKMELSQAQAELAQLRKTHDKLKDETHAKQKLILELKSQLDELKRASNPDNFQNIPGEPQTLANVQEIQTQLEENNKKVQTAIIQKQSLNHMIKRATSEILEIKRNTKSLQSQMRTVENELGSSTLHFQHAKQELKNEERKLESLKAKVDVRKKEQEDRLQGLERIMEERTILLDRQDERIKKRDQTIIRGQGEVTEDDDDHMKRSLVVRNVFSTILEDRVLEHRENLARLENTFQQIKNVTGLSEVDQIVEKFMSRSEKNQALESLAEEIRGRIEALKGGNLALKQQLADLASAAEVSAGNREVYHEVDLIDEALSSARKHCEESKDKANRLHLTLDSLTDALVRFVKKVDGLLGSNPNQQNMTMAPSLNTTKVAMNLPSTPERTSAAQSVVGHDQIQTSASRLNIRVTSAGRHFGDPSTLSLPDLVTLLDTKISQVMKSVNAALIIEDRSLQNQPASPGSHRASISDYVGGSTGPQDSMKELTFSKIDTSNINRLLYHSLMAAEVDVSKNNLRTRKGTIAEPPGVLDSKRMLGYPEPSEVSSDDEDRASGVDHINPKEDEVREPTLDREMIKKVSSLILGQDHGKKKKSRGKNPASRNSNR